MSIISFDIGIKNLAYCIFSLKNASSLQILDWNVINLLDDSKKPVVAMCNCQKAKNSGICGKKAVYTYGPNYYCNIHSKNSGKLFPTKETSMSTIKKLKMDEQRSFAQITLSLLTPKIKSQKYLQKFKHILKKTRLSQ